MPESRYRVPREEQELFFFEPPLPSLWSRDSVAEEHLKEGCATDEEAERLYSSTVAKVDANDWKVPRRKFGRSKLTMPLLSIGGGGFHHAVAFRGAPRLLFGFFPPVVVLLVAVFGSIGLAIAAPFVLFLHSVWLGVALLVSAPALFYTLAALVALEHESLLARPLLKFAARVGMNHVETARHCT